MIHATLPTLHDINRTLNQFSSLQADFQQTNPDGTTSEGVFYLHKPIGLKFVYTQPLGQFVLGTGDWLMFYDPDLAEENYIALDQTPAHMLLTQDIDLQKLPDIQPLLYHEAHPLGAIHVRLIQPHAQHVMTLHFKQDAHQQLEIVGWSIQDEAGKITQMLLTKRRYNAPIDPKIFVHRKGPRKR